MKMFERNLPPTVHTMANLQASDMPASRKFQGSAGHSHKTHPCNFCFITQLDINRPTGYQPESEPLFFLTR